MSRLGLLGARRTNSAFLSLPTTKGTQVTLSISSSSRLVSMPSGRVTISGPIQEGGFAKIYLAEYPATQDGIKVVVKLHKRDSEWSSSEMVRRVWTDAVIQVSENEVEISKSLGSHPNILSFLGVGSIPEWDARDVLVLPWCRNGNIVEYLKGTSVTVTRSKKLSLFQQVVSGIEYLHHDQRIMHGDIKGANVLIRDDETACLCDFDLAQEMTSVDGDGGDLSAYDSRPSRLTGLFGTVQFMAPEVLMDGISRPTTWRDIWSFGCLMFQVLTGSIPYAGISMSHHMIHLSQEKLPDRPSGLIEDPEWAVITKCWSFTPEKRPAATALLELLLAIQKAADTPDDTEELQTTNEILQQLDELTKPDENEQTEQQESGTEQSETEHAVDDIASGARDLVDAVKGLEMSSFQTWGPAVVAALDAVAALHPVIHGLAEVANIAINAELQKRENGEQIIAMKNEMLKMLGVVIEIVHLTQPALEALNRPAEARRPGSKTLGAVIANAKEHIVQCNSACEKYEASSWAGKRIYGKRWKKQVDKFLATFKDLKAEFAVAMMMYNIARNEMRDARNEAYLVSLLQVVERQGDEIKTLTVMHMETQTLLRARGG